MKKSTSGFEIYFYGTVQGVGFRPLLKKIAVIMKIRGYCINLTGKVKVYLEADKKTAEEYIRRIKNSNIKGLVIEKIVIKRKKERIGKEFIIKKSEKLKTIENISILPDAAVCEECLEEFYNHKNRRYKYAFITCNKCGPRFSILKDIPFDRENTSMDAFSMCKECLKDYTDVFDRRFHAQTTSCEKCGVKLMMKIKNKVITDFDEIIEKSVSLIKKDKILALKGIGGFQIICSALSDRPVKKLRNIKKRDIKPFAVMFKNIIQIKNYCKINKYEKQALLNFANPIVILKNNNKNNLSRYVSMDLKTTGCFLPYTALHHYLLKKIDIPLITTSANISDEPIYTEEEEVMKSFAVDAVITNNRDIINHCDDSVGFCSSKRFFLIRRARGYVPEIIKTNLDFKNKKILACGSDLKSSFAINLKNNIYVSQYIGDLDNKKTFQAYKKQINFILKSLNYKPDIIAADAHPDYYSSNYAFKLAKKYKAKLVHIQHHIAHSYAVMLENDIDNCVCVCLDGLGYGLDKTLWGGEILEIKKHNVKRKGFIKPILILNSDISSKECLIPLAGHLYNLSKQIKDIEYPEKLYQKFKKKFKIDLENYFKILEKGINTIYTSSAGRLFDAAAALIEISYYNDYEARSPILLENYAYKSKTKKYYLFEIKDGKIDFSLSFYEMLNDKKLSIPAKAKKIHNTVIQAVYKFITENYKNRTNIIFAGGCFQNKILLDGLIEKLNKKYKIYLPKELPFNDEAISFGQMGTQMGTVVSDGDGCNI